MSYRDFGLPDTGSSTRLNVPTNQFEIDASDGFTSANFDLNENIQGGDIRAGLDDGHKLELTALMSEGRDFDQARLELNRQRMRDAGIDPDTGLPNDPRAVTFEDLRRISDKSFRTRCRTLMKRILTPRRVVVILLVAAFSYWVIIHSDWIPSLSLITEQWVTGP